MINRNNKYASLNKEELKKVTSRKKGMLVAVGGMLLTAMIMTGCGKKQDESKVGTVITPTEVEILFDDVNEIDMSSFDANTQGIRIYGSNLTDVSELANYPNLEFVDLRDNLISDVTPLENLDNVERLYLSDNSITQINLENYKNLKELEVKGNYNLYSDSLIDYCNEHNIKIDITKENVKEVESLKEILSTLNLEGKTEIEKEKIISDYVIKHMTYDKKALKNDELTEEYNKQTLKYALEGRGVCANYTELFNAMCQLSGINAYKVHGLGGGKFTGGPHVWSLVEIDGQYMLCDETWLDQQLFNIPLPISQTYAKNMYYNKTGESVKSFNKKHDEGYKGYSFQPSDVKSNMAVESDIREIEGYETFGEKAENVKNEGVDFIIEKANTVVEGIDSLNLDMQDIMKKVMIGVGAGSVILFSSKVSKELSKKIKENKSKQKDIKIENKPQRRFEPSLEVIKRKEQQKSDVQINIETPQVHQQSFPAPTETPQAQEVSVKPPEPTFEEKLNMLSDDEKAFFIENHASELLKEAAEFQVKMEISNGLTDKTFIDKKIEAACNEINQIMNTTRYEKALYRCKKYGYLPNTSLDNLSQLEREALDATVRLYDQVDDKVSEYRKMLDLLDKVKKETQVSENLNTGYGLN